MIKTVARMFELRVNECSATGDLISHKYLIEFYLVNSFIVSFKRDRG